MKYDFRGDKKSQAETEEMRRASEAELNLQLGGLLLIALPFLLFVLRLATS